MTVVLDQGSGSSVGDDGRTFTMAKANVVWKECGNGGGGGFYETISAKGEKHVSHHSAENEKFQVSRCCFLIVL